MAPAVTLQKILREVLAAQFAGVQSAMAEALDLDPTHLSRALRGMVTTLSIESALTLARLCDLDPDAVLAAAGKASTAQDIRRLYGKAAPVRGTQTAEERAWLAALHALGPEHRQAVLSVARGLAGAR